MFSDGTAKTSVALTTLSVRSGSGTVQVNALKQIDMEMIQKAETARLSITREARKSNIAHKRRSRGPK
jgi:hypothetical protein